MCVRSGVDSNNLFLFFDRRSRESILVNLIGSLLDKRERVSTIVRSTFRHFIRNGLQFACWIDNWHGHGELKELFPRIFALDQINKHEPVYAFGQWNDKVWEWNVYLQRRPLDWEAEVWENFNSIL